MLLSSLLWATTLLLFHWHSRLVSAHRHRVLISGILLCGLVSAMSILALGFMDTRLHLAGHNNAAVLFFTSSWTTVGLICLLRRRLSKPPPSSINVIAEGAAAIGLVSCAFRGVAALCTSEVFPNLLSLSPSHVALAEYAIVAALATFAATLSHEVAVLTPLVEAKYFSILQRGKGK
ncbi:hypothetical protein H310_01025 [Aphanomyces invadans]|uniref:CWH43-like N-terminal domain-containing protein n=1 Tax=Aphanomyces invadans TaxID=157072 RepID=A0A024UQA0_9STRA|nr:hypothetical protein H310_01025 [Aphanomyces invadans]ETW08444.1 hypothetical protein H310_01025 [Aphanomyces invadans]|eukprot:XP_008862249.1 hypothetical protein H310_01025 [Aphanomyces invadans]